MQAEASREAAMQAVECADGARTSPDVASGFELSCWRESPVVVRDVKGAITADSHGMR